VNARRVLLVSYHFPPVGGAGVQRPAKFARYLPEFGWDVSVLQAANPSVPLLDPSLLAELPPETVIAKARTLEPSYAAKQASGISTPASPTPGRPSLLRRVASTVLQPDPQILWYPAAMREGRALLRRLKHDAILATAPSYSNLLVGARLARWSGLPLLSDFRDEWDISSTYWENAAQGALVGGIQQRMQRAVLRRSRAIIATTQASTARLAERALEAGSRATSHCIYNGWDAHDLAAAGSADAVAPRLPDTVRLVYTGTLWNLTSIAPVIDAIRKLAAESPALLARLELVVVGRKTPEQQALMAPLARLGVRLADIPYCDHAVALATMQSADALLLLLSDLPGAERVAPAKVFEYLAVARPILAVMPEGEIAAMVRDAQRGGHYLPADIAGIADWLQQLLRGSVPAPAPSAAAPFERRALAGELATVLNRAVAGVSR
jgi:glycosyltransferase involved in cell wall biosynthesis